MKGPRLPGGPPVPGPLAGVQRSEQRWPGLRAFRALFTAHGRPPRPGRPSGFPAHQESGQSPELRMGPQRAPHVTSIATLEEKSEVQSGPLSKWPSRQGSVEAELGPLGPGGLSSERVTSPVLGLQVGSGP